MAEENEPQTTAEPTQQEQPAQEGQGQAQKNQSAELETLRRQVESLQSQMAMMIKSGYEVAPKAQQQVTPQSVQAATIPAQFAPKAESPYANVKPLEEYDYSI